LEVDPDHHIFRRLYPEEIPPSIAKVFGSSLQAVVLSTLGTAKGLEKNREAADLINKTQTAVIKLDSEMLDEELNTRSVIFLGIPAEGTPASNFFNRLNVILPWDQEISLEERMGSVVVSNHPIKEELGAMIIKCNEWSDVRSIVRKLPHYGKYSYLLFSGDENIKKGIWRIESSPLIHIFNKKNYPNLNNIYKQ
jgi:hypothetical protein